MAEGAEAGAAVELTRAAARCPPRSRPQPDGTRVLATPRLSGTILPGITRDSILQLAASWGECDVEERAVTIAEVRQVRAQGAAFEGSEGEGGGAASLPGRWLQFHWGIETGQVQPAQAACSGPHTQLCLCCLAHLP